MSSISQQWNLTESEDWRFICCLEGRQTISEQQKKLELKKCDFKDMFLYFGDWKDEDQCKVNEKSVQEPRNDEDQCRLATTPNGEQLLSLRLEDTEI